MEETRYMISDASKRLNIESHTLRYWQDELELEIPRNELGHRYYRDEDIATISKIKKLKDQGFQLKAIKMLLPDLDKLEALDPVSLLKLREEVNDNEDEKDMGEATMLPSDCNKAEVDKLTKTDRMDEFRAIMKDIFTEALKDNHMDIDSLTLANHDSVVIPLIKHMEYLKEVQEEKEEERYRQVDRMLREAQNGNLHTAASKEKRKRIFKGGKLIHLL